MFRDKKLRELLIGDSIDEDFEARKRREPLLHNYRDEIRDLERKLNALADHLGLEWQEEHTEGWVKKRRKFDGTPANRDDTFVFFGTPDISGPYEVANQCHCGFIAKNSKGLKSHQRQVHKK